MSIKEQIYAEIERLLEFDKTVKTNYYIGRRDAEMEILAFLDTIEAESPEGLEQIEGKIILSHGQKVIEHNSQFGIQETSFPNIDVFSVGDEVIITAERK